MIAVFFFPFCKHATSGDGNKIGLRESARVCVIGNEEGRKLCRCRLLLDSPGTHTLRSGLGNRVIGFRKVNRERQGIEPNQKGQEGKKQEKDK